MKYLVSGATGFIGRELCRRLTAGGGTVVALSRSGGSVEPGLPSLAVDLTTEQPITELLQGVDVVFHLAGIAHQSAAPDEYEKLNYRATVQLARMASDAGVRCFIFLSSVKAMGAPVGSGARSENECVPPADPYGISKWRAEVALRENFAQDSMSVVIVRPALVYGANAKGNLQFLLRGVRCGLPRPPAGGKRSMIALDDLVDLLYVIAKQSPPGLHTWIACGNQSYSAQAMYDLLREAAGMQRGTAWLPTWGWRAGAWLLDKLTRSVADTTFNRLFGGEEYTNSAVVAYTSWCPQYGLEDVVGQIAGGERAEP